MTSPLLRPVGLGARRAPNRVMFGPHETNLGHRRALSARHVAYYRRRASGGCGTVVVETASVHPGDWPYERAPLAAECAEGWAAIGTAVRGEGALALASLGHAGGQGSTAYSQGPLWGPSRFPDPATREVPQQMEPEEVAAVVEGFAAAAAAAAAAGMDGVEVNAGQSSLVRQFLSGLTNSRGDDYGGDRLLFARQVLAAVRQGLGEGRVLGLRLGCDELAPWAGITPEASVAIAQDLARYADYVVAERSPAFDLGGHHPDGHTPPGFALPLAQGLRAALDGAVPVVAQGSLVDVDLAEAALADGAADLVDMGRALIADPDLVAKVAAGARSQVRPCLLCNQRCRVRDPRNPIVSCVAEPSSGYESEDPPLEGSPPRMLDLLVVGAGPAGLEAARVAALRGHRVRVVERAEAAGGALRAASHGSGRERLALLVDWLEAECLRLGVRIETGTAATVADLDAHEAAGGAALLCTGSVPGRRHFATDGSVDEVDARRLLELAAGGGLATLPDGPVVVDDPVGDAVGISVAELLAAAGRDVSLVTGDLVPGVQLSRTGDLAAASARLARAGVTVLKRTAVAEVLGGSLQVEDGFTGAKGAVRAAVLVDASHRLPDDELWSARPRLARAGDAVAPRTAYEAVLEGRRAVLALEMPR